VHGREVCFELRPLILRVHEFRLQFRQCAIRVGAIRLPFVAFVNQLSALFAQFGIGVFGVRQSGLEFVARLRCDGGVGMSDTYTVEKRRKQKISFEYADICCCLLHNKAALTIQLFDQIQTSTTCLRAQSIYRALDPNTIITR
jgi:hypothetical protein